MLVCISLGFLGIEEMYVKKLSKALDTSPQDVAASVISQIGSILLLEAGLHFPSL